MTPINIVIRNVRHVTSLRVPSGCRRRIASESFVLLKNDNQTLPLKPTGTIAVIGPLADTRSNMPGTWSVAAVLDRSPSLIEGLREMVGRMDEMPLNQPNEPWYIPLMENGVNINLLYAKGSNLISDAAYEERATMFGRSLNRDNRTDAELLKEALETANKADVIIAVLGESSEMSGESSQPYGSQSTRCTTNTVERTGSHRQAGGLSAFYRPPVDIELGTGQCSGYS